MKIGTVVTMIGAFFMLAFVATAYGATDLSLPGIPAAGTPYFLNDVTLQASSLPSGGYKLTAKEAEGGDFTFTLGDQTYGVIGGSYSLTAFFNSVGEFDPNESFVSVKGTFSDSDLGALKSITDPKYYYLLNAGDLFTARMDAFAFDLNSSGTSALGFQTTDFVGWAAQFGKTESVYLYGFNPGPETLIPFFASLTSGSLQAQAHTTVPAPSAIWLLGSSLLGYVLIANRLRA